MTPCPFDVAFEWILRVEGGYVDDPKDTGGETKYGISSAAYPGMDIKNLTKEQAKNIYYNDYFIACRCPEMPGPIGLALFDGSVNQGKDAAVKTLQKTLKLKEDGIVGEKTLGAAAKATPGTLVDYLTNRQLRYQGTKGAETYIRGWTRRLFDLQCWIGAPKVLW